MYVRADYRGLGIAQRLLALLTAWSATSGVRCLYLETNAAWVAAHHIYEKHGFVEVSRSDLPPEFPVVRVATGFFRRCTTAAHACRVIEDRRDDPIFDAKLAAIEAVLARDPEALR